MAETQPMEPGALGNFALVVSPGILDGNTGAHFVHKDLVEVVAPWANEAHISPPKGEFAFGDVESWVAYVERYGGAGTFLTWNSLGFHAELDHHGRPDSNGIVMPGRCQWIARHPFTKSREWAEWTAFANGHPKSQKEAIEFLEDHGEAVVEPTQADLLGILRDLRANVRANSAVELRPDGTSKVEFTSDRTVQGKTAAIELPSTITIGIPVLRGHMALNTEGKPAPVTYKLAVRLRVSVDDSAHLALRFSIPLAERALEDAFADRVAAAQTLLGEAHSLLRADG